MKIGRNEPCPCGSGKKWKKCHGDPTRGSAQGWPTEDFLTALQPSRSLRIADILPQVSKLQLELREFDAIKVVSAAATLASLDYNHTFIFRLDTLILLAAAYCTGDRIPTLRDLARWLNQEIAASDINRLEDPAEDFAVGIVSTGNGDRLILNGSLSGPDAYLQEVLDTLTSGPGLVEPIRRAAMAALEMSDELVRRRGYNRFTMGRPGDGVTLPDNDEELWRLTSSQIVTISDVGRLALSEADLLPFVCSFDDLKASALQQQIVHVREKFLVRLGDAFLPVFPTSIADAITAHALAHLDQLNAREQRALDRRPRSVCWPAMKRMSSSHVPRTCAEATTNQPRTLRNRPSISLPPARPGADGTAAEVLPSAVRNHHTSSAREAD